MKKIVSPFLAAVLLAAAHAAAAQGYQQTNLVTDNQSVTPALLTDPNLVNPWGIALSSAGGAFWVSDNGSGVSSLYTGDVNGSAFKVSTLVVTAPGSPGGTTGSPTGQIFNNSGGGFDVPVGGGTSSAVFITDSEDGTISGWNPGVNRTQAQLAVTTPGAVYKGLAIAGSNLYAADFSQGTIDVFDSSFTPTGSFTDPNAAAGYAPFNVQNLGGSLFVTYALQDASKHDNGFGVGTGFVDEFDTSGNLIKRIGTGTAVGGTTSALDAPWGLALAPSNFGKYSNDLLVGNFGRGQSSVFDPASGAFQGVLKDAAGNPLVNNGLWGLTFGNGVSAGDTNKLYFSAGTNFENDGLFGSIAAPAAVPEASTMISFGALLALGGLALVARRKKSGTRIIACSAKSPALKVPGFFVPARQRSEITLICL